MAFSFDTLVNDQKQSAIDVVDAITPIQARQLGNAYKEGLNASPKQVINETLEQFTGINFSQTAGVDGLGAAAKNFISEQGGMLAMQLEQQVLGCINTAIRDLMNKHPEVDFILNFEDRINLQAERHPLPDCLLRPTPAENQLRSNQQADQILHPHRFDKSSC